MSSDPPEPRAHRTLLTVAARSIALASGLPAQDRIHERALRHYGEAVRQYLAIRTGSESRAQRAWQRVRARAEAELAGADPERVRPLLYRMAREAAGREGPPDPLAALPWRPPRGEGITPALLDRVRNGLTEEEAELLELRHARELSPEEIATVLQQPVDRVLEGLAEAAAHARALVEPAKAPLKAVLLEAFALQPAPGPAADPGVPAALPTGAVVGERYAIQERVGTGAFGDVYQARDTEVPGHVVALKLLHHAARTEEARAAALRELHLIASVFHPSVVQFKDHGWHEGRLWFVMPWYEGETLEARIAHAPLERGEARRIFEPLARALGTMHAAGIRHQDVKPENIFLARIPGFGGRNGGEQVLPVLLDLGVAAKEAEMVVAGTPTYFAPEVAAQFAEAEKRPPVGPKADVFALALSLRNALEPDTQPDVPAGAVETFIEERSRTLPPMPRSRELRYLEPSLRRWMSLDPDERPTADELAEELAVLTRPEERRRRVTGVLRWLAPAAVALLAVFGAVVYGLHTRAERQELLTQRARRAEAGLRQDLTSSKAQQRALEAHVQAVREEYERSRMSRAQLADELGRIEGEREQLERRLERTRERLAQRERDLTKTRDTLGETEEQLTSTRSDLQNTRREAERTAARADHLGRELQAMRDDLTDATDRVAQLKLERDAVRDRLDQERDKGDHLEDQLDQARAARTRAEQELARLKQEKTEEKTEEDEAPEPILHPTASL
ncbi:MAG: protein kinase domain-containing protein [Myxococcota bacterium]